jgi:hypothetical protein
MISHGPHPGLLHLDATQAQDLGNLAHPPVRVFRSDRQELSPPRGDRYSSIKNVFRASGAAGAAFANGFRFRLMCVQSGPSCHGVTAGPTQLLHLLHNPTATRDDLDRHRPRAVRTLRTNRDTTGARFHARIVSDHFDATPTAKAQLTAPPSEVDLPCGTTQPGGEALPRLPR